MSKRAVASMDPGVTAFREHAAREASVAGFVVPV